MKKLLLGALLLVASTVSFGRFESQFGYKVVENHAENGTLLINDKYNCALAVIKQGDKKFTNNEFYDIVDKAMNGKEYKIHHSGTRYILTTSKGYYPVLFINNGKSILYIDIPNEEHLEKASQYLKMNEISTVSTDFIISEVMLKLSLDELNKLIGE